MNVLLGDTFANIPDDNQAAARLAAANLKVTKDCPDSVEIKAQAIAQSEIFETLDVLSGEDCVNRERKFYAGLVMGQYLFDRLCSPESDPLLQVLDSEVVLHGYGDANRMHRFGDIQ